MYTCYLEGRFNVNFGLILTLFHYIVDVYMLFCYILFCVVQPS